MQSWPFHVDNQVHITKSVIVVHQFVNQQALIRVGLGMLKQLLVLLGALLRVRANAAVQINNRLDILHSSGKSL